jgi:hypothetical protein
MPSAELLKALRKQILAEMEKRARQRGLDLGKDYRTILYERLDAMKERREQLGSPYAPPTQAEKDDLIAYLTTRAEAAVKG